MDWISLKKQLPAYKEIVEAKVDDEKGERMISELMLIGNLWFVPDGSIYVYYSPTHWRPKTNN